jgi:hypothetical protein
MAHPYSPRNVESAITTIDGQYTNCEGRCHPYRRERNFRQALFRGRDSISLLFGAMRLDCGRKLGKLTTI